jgi:hypothetical protein
MKSGCEFHVIVRGNRIEGKIFTPGHQRWEPGGDGEIKRKPHLDTIKVLEQWLKRWQMLTRLQEYGRDKKLDLLVPETFTALGTHLWMMAFDNDVGRQLETRYKLIDEGKLDYVRVRISFETDPDIAALPWEFVCHPKQSGIREFYLASEFKLILGRYIDGLGNKEIAPADDKVRVLFTTSLPERKAFRSARKEADRLIRLLEVGEQTGKAMEIERVDSWDAEKVGAALQALARDGHPVDVVHLTALFRIHDQKMQVYLTDLDAESSEPTSNGDVPDQTQHSDSWQLANTVVNVLTSQYRPTLLVLALSDWEGEFPAHFEQLAPDFVNAGIPAVLAMQYPMSSEQGMKFLTSFYAALTEGAEIGEAVQTGRRELMLRKVDRNFGTPVLYMQSARDAQLMRAAIPLDNVTETEHRTRGVVPQPRAGAKPREPAADVKRRLLDAISTASALLDPHALEATREWIESADWTNAKSARLAIKARHRASKPDDTFQNIARYLNKVLDDYATEGES